MFMEPFGSRRKTAQERPKQPEGNESSARENPAAAASRRQQNSEQRGGQFDDLGEQQGDLRDKLQSLIDRLRIDGAKPAGPIR